MPHRRVIGLISTFISGRFFEQVMSGIQTVAWQNQIDVLVIQGTPEQVALTQLAYQRVDGWLVLTYTQGLDLLALSGKPIVTISCRVPAQPFPAVFPDNRQGMEGILQHLLEQGHKRIAFVGDTSIGDIQERYLAYQEILARHNLPPDPEQVVITRNPLPEEGAWAARRLMAARLPCTAIVAGNDWTAIGLMRELQEHGYRIPEDVAVVGFDDIPEAQITHPPLSTVRQHSDKVGETATRLLIAQMGGQPLGPVVETVPTTFVERESSSKRLLTRFASYSRREIPVSPAWRASLARELVQILLPALSRDANPSPSQVWPEVDKLIHLLEIAIQGSISTDEGHALLQAVFASLPMLNASPETLVEMLSLLETAGLRLTEQHPDPAIAYQRLQALRDQLLIELMRSYRRRQNRSQRTQSEILRGQYNISQMLVKGPPQQVAWIGETNMYSACLGLWLPVSGEHSPVLSIAGSYIREGNPPLRVGTTYSAARFPPLDRLPSSAQKKDITTCLVLPVRTADHDWGLLAVSGPLISEDPWLEDNTVNIFEISCSVLGLALEREALQETLRHVSEAERQLNERVRDLSAKLTVTSQE